VKKVKNIMGIIIWGFNFLTTFLKRKITGICPRGRDTSCQVQFGEKLKFKWKE